MTIGRAVAPSMVGAFVLAILLAAVPGNGSQQGASPIRSRMVDQKPVTVGGRALQANYIELTIEPGGSSPAHRHAGAVLGYVLEGTLVFAIEDEPEREIPAGGVFVEPEGVVHRVFRGGSQNGARVLAIIVAEPGATLTTPP